MIIYRFAIWLYEQLICLAAVFNPKAKLFLQGRKGWKEDLLAREFLGNVIWFHCASLGEFEQGRPVIEACRAAYPECCLLLTFFSPSGYEVRKDYKGVDHVLYLPLDRRSNVEFFMDQVKPKLALFVKYEVWPGYFKALSSRSVPILLFSAIFRENQVYFKWYGRLFRNCLEATATIFVQDKCSLKLLARIGIKQVILAGDTRFDRVVAISERFNPLEMIKTFKQNKLLVIIGSSWEPEEEMLLDFMQRNAVGFKLIVAPHEVGMKRIEALQEKFEGSLLYTETRMSDLKTADVLIVNTVGILSKLYSEGDIAFIGGGFGKGLHNTLEAAVFGLTILMGPNHEQFKEAVDLRELGGAFCVSNQSKFDEVFGKLLEDEKMRLRSCSTCKNYVLGKVGATRKVVNTVKKILG